jgi:hypothetical protein
LREVEEVSRVNEEVCFFQKRENVLFLRLGPRQAQDGVPPSFDRQKSCGRAGRHLPQDFQVILQALLQLVLDRLAHLEQGSGCMLDGRIDG